MASRRFMAPAAWASSVSGGMPAKEITEADVFFYFNLNAGHLSWMPVVTGIVAHFNFDVSPIPPLRASRR
jgi:hypothetical protein